MNAFWREHTTNMLKANGYEVPAYGTLLRRTFTQALIQPYWHAVIEYAKQQKIDRSELYRRLGITASTMRRHQNKNIYVSGETVFSAIAISLNCSWHQLPDVPPSLAIADAICMQLAVIANEHVRSLGNLQRLPTYEELACLKIISMHHHAGLLVDPHASVDINGFCDAVIDRLLSKLPSCKINSRSAVRSVIVQWLDAWIILLCTLPEQWKLSQ